ncbi:MAG TPA: flagellar basal body L-ring protein FlgH [Bryobacteraceae bacterium]|nr:flagellar basal body L-ring protein FlgH [Bryobacteraceae bacterium]
MFFIVALIGATASAKKPQVPTSSALDLYIQEAGQRASVNPATSTGSLWSSSDARLGDLTSDLRARRIDDVVTIIVAERASALSRGSVTASRKASASVQVDGALGTRTTGWLPILGNLGSDRKLDGSGETIRETELNTILSARVTHVLPNGNLVVEGTKAVTVNSETQKVQVRGVVRPYDLSTGNAVRSDQIAMLEVSVAGRGVIADAVRQPNLLYRLLLGILPF